MNIDKELYMLNNSDYKSLEKELGKQISELRKKQYFFSVKNILDILTEKYKNNFFDKKIKYFSFKQKYDEDTANEVFKNLKLVDENNIVVSENPFACQKEYDLLNDLFDIDTFTLNEDACNEKIFDKIIKVKIDENMIDNLKEYLLNEELCKVYDYTVMKSETKEKPIKQGTKI